MTNNTFFLSHFILFVFVFFSLLFSVFTMEYYLLEDGLLMPDSFFDARVIEESRTEVHAMIKSTKSILPRSINILSNRVCFPPFHNAMMFNTFDFLSNGYHYRSFSSISSFSSSSRLVDIGLYQDLNEISNVSRTISQILDLDTITPQQIKYFNSFAQIDFASRLINVNYDNKIHQLDHVLFKLHTFVENIDALLNSVFFRSLDTETISKFKSMRDVVMVFLSNYRLSGIEHLNECLKIYTDNCEVAHLNGCSSIDGWVIPNHLCLCIYKENQVILMTVTTKPTAEVYYSVADFLKVYPDFNLTDLTDISKKVCFCVVKDKDVPTYIRFADLTVSRSTYDKAVNEALYAIMDSSRNTMAANKSRNYAVEGRFNFVMIHDICNMVQKCK